MVTAFLPILFTIFIVVDPIGFVPIYISVTAHLDAVEKKRTIQVAALTAFFVLSVFIVAGKWLLELLGVSPGSFFIAGGIMLFLVSLEMLFGKPSQSKVSARETPHDAGTEERTSIAIFPLAIPMLAGPGAITSIILFTSSDSTPILTMAMLFLATAFTLITAVVTVRASALVLRVLGSTGVSVIERIMGLLLSGLAVQFVYDGLVKLGVISGFAR